MLIRCIYDLQIACLKSSFKFNLNRCSAHFWLRGVRQRSPQYVLPPVIATLSHLLLHIVPRVFNVNSESLDLLWRRNEKTILLIVFDCLLDVMHAQFLLNVYKKRQQKWIAFGLFLSKLCEQQYLVKPHLSIPWGNIFYIRGNICEQSLLWTFFQVTVIGKIVTKNL